MEGKYLHVDVSLCFRYDPRLLVLGQRPDIGVGHLDALARERDRIVGQLNLGDEVFGRLVELDDPAIFGQVDKALARGAADKSPGQGGGIIGHNQGAVFRGEQIQSQPVDKILVGSCHLLV